MEVQVTCGWCKKHLSSTEWEEMDDRLPPETHSICDECNELLMIESASISNNIQKNN